MAKAKSKKKKVKNKVSNAMVEVLNELFEADPQAAYLAQTIYVKANVVS